MRITFLIVLFALGSASGATRSLRNLSGKGGSKSGVMKERPSKKGVMSKLAKKGMGMKNPVNCASVYEGDILANNGIVHKITRLLFLLNSLSLTSLSVIPT
jgi:hypothetical protein